MTIQSSVVYPSGLASFRLAERLITLTDVCFQETHGGVIEGAPRPNTDAMLRRGFLAELERRWGQRALHVVEPEVVEVRQAGDLIPRMPAVACAAWLHSNPVNPKAGAASELVLVWWVESLSQPLGPIVERALAGVEWAREAQDFDY